jgi:hypothetical protein
VEESDVRHELEATLAARQEVGAGLEPQLVERFVDRIEKEIDRRVDARLAQRQMPRDHIDPRVPLGSIALGIGATAVANGMGAAGIVVAIVAWLAIAAVNVVYALRR